MILKATLLIFTIANCGANNDNLIAVVQIFRHGERVPYTFYPTDPYRDLDTYWGGLDYNQLTNVGKRQQLELGQFTRSRYSDWLPAIYSRKDIFVQTTDSDRTHMSAQSNLYGLYPASGDQVWQKNTDWQPIPIHPTDPRVMSTLPYPCHAFDNNQKEIYSQNYFRNLDITYASTYDILSKNSNMNITHFYEGRPFYDCLYVEEQVGYIHPPWVSAIYPEPLSTLYSKIFEANTFNTQAKRLYIGVMFNTIIEYFEGMIKNSTSSPKYQMYSSHEGNVLAILDCVGQKPANPVPFSVSLWFELRKFNSINVVQLWMKSEDNFTQLSINGCDLNCPLTKVKSLLGDILLDADTYEEECKNKI